MQVSRRAYLKAMSAMALSPALGWSAIPQAFAQGSSPALKWGTMAGTSNFSRLVIDYMLAKGIDKANDLRLGKPVLYSNVTTYYNDFTAGNYDIGMGSWDTWASRYLAAVPLQYVCSVTTGSLINIVVQGQGPANIQGLKGKTLAAPQSTGTYRMMRATIKELTGIDIESHMVVQNVDNPSAAMMMVMADRADACLAWEPIISDGIKRAPTLRVLYNAGQEYRRKFGLDLPYFGVAIRKEAIARDPTVVTRLNKAFAQCIEGIVNNIDEAVSIASADSGIPADVLKMAIASKRLEFKYASMQTEEGRRTIRVANEFLVRNGALAKVVDDGFFAA